MNAPLLELARVHAPLLMIVVPLVGAALSIVVGNARVSWIVASAAAVVTAVLAADLAARVLIAGAPTPMIVEGMALRPDGVAIFASALVAAAMALTTIGAGAVARDFSPSVAPFAWALLLCMGAGWIGALMAQHYAALFVSVASAWLASVGLTALTGDRERGALNGALRMLSAGGAAAALMLLGIGFVARAAGSGDVAALAVAPVGAPDLAGVGIGLMMLALAVNAGVAPLHVWLGAAFGRGGALAALAIGAIGVVGALGVLLRIGAFAMAAPAISSGVAAALLVLGVASIVIGSFQAIGATNLRRLAAYAGAAQAGCILLTAALGSPAAFAAAFVQLFALCAAAIALLGGAAVIGGVTDLSALDGLSRRAPLASVAIMMGALSLMGAPLTVGFLGRWRLIEAGVGAGWWGATGAVIAASLAAVFYGGRLIERIYFRRAGGAVDVSEDLWRLALAPALMTAILAIALGLEPSLLLRAAERASAILVGEGA